MPLSVCRLRSYALSSESNVKMGGDLVSKTETTKCLEFMSTGLDYVKSLNLSASTIFRCPLMSPPHGPTTFWIT